MIKFSSVFKPTPLYKELQILNLLTNNPQVTQRGIASAVGISLAMVNYYLEAYEKEGVLKISRDSTRAGLYTLTKKGHEKRKLLNMEFLEASLDVYNQAKLECINFIDKIKNEGYRKLVFYGAGEVCELLLYVINNINETDLSILAVIDDDSEKIGKDIVGVNIIAINDLNKYQYDGVLVSSYTHNDKIKKKLLDLGISEEIIIEFFKGDPD